MPSVKPPGSGQTKIIHGKRSNDCENKQLCLCTHTRIHVGRERRKRILLLS